MDEETIERLNGSLAGISSVMAALISTLSPLQAAQMALSLKISNEDDKTFDEPTETPHAEARNGIVEGYLNLLQSVSKRAG